MRNIWKIVVVVVVVVILYATAQLTRTGMDDLTGHLSLIDRAVEEAQ